MGAQHIYEDIISVGVKDTKSPYFDQLMPLPDGTTYNSFIIKGSEKVALIESVDGAFQEEFLENLKQANIEKIDYIISNHAEQDHSGCFEKLIEMYPNVKIITNEKCKELLQQEMNIKNEQFQIIVEGEEITLGNKTLSFMMTPWCHWPETMITYLKEDKILFSGDLFGAHIAFEQLISHDQNYIKPMKRYYAEIMMPFSLIISKHIKKIQELEIKIIAPTHGQIYMNAQEILNLYEEWTTHEAKKKVSIIYVSMHHSTEMMANYLSEKLTEKGVENKIHNLMTEEIGDITVDIMDSNTLVVCSPTYLGGLHPQIANALFLINGFKPKVKNIAFLNSHGWQANIAESQLKEFLKIPHAQFIDSVMIEGKPKEEDKKRIEQLAEQIKNKINS